MDNELFELCKEVYKRTGWDHSSLNNSFKQLQNHQLTGWKDWFIADYNNHINNGVERSIPIYTSDYLLEKLPIHLGDPLGIAEYLRLEPLTKGKWAACYGNNKSLDEWSDTPLKALLKLTIALDDAEELK